ncbi:hypothetical protein ACFXGA_00535 [Actinosynnema sp. NPDC059335]|uniref:hypothetical protein n=1 Tax=Actinosynnema sp. NPDC059335 TaxID=3346804 RepID=UPI00366FEF80
MTTTTAHGWVPVVAWTQVALGLAGIVAFATSTTAGVAVAGAVALVALVHRALRRASADLDRILDEELGR